MVSLFRCPFVGTLRGVWNTEAFWECWHVDTRFRVFGEACQLAFPSGTGSSGAEDTLWTFL